MSDTAWIDDFVKKRREEEQLKCPVCGAVAEDEDLYGYVTYWGEDGPQPYQCQECDADLLVEECVRRTYEVRRAPDES